MFKDPTLLPVVFPGLMEVQRTHLRPAASDERIVDVDYCPNAQAIHHLEPIDDVVIREWGADGTLQASTLLLGRLAKGALTAKPQDVPLMREKLDWLLERCGASKNSHAYREMRALFNHLPRRELLYADAASLKTLVDRMVYMSSDNEIVVTTRTGQGYETVSVAFSDVRYSHRVEEDLKRALGEAFGPIAFNTWADLRRDRPARLLLRSDAGSSTRSTLPQVHAIVERVISTWEDRVGVTLEQTYGPAEGRRLFTRYIRSESRSGMYRESTRPEDVPEDLRRLETIEGRLETHVRVDTADSATLTIYSPRPLGLTVDAAHAPAPGAAGAGGAVDPADAARRSRPSPSSA